MINSIYIIILQEMTDGGLGASDISFVCLKKVSSGK